jgi:hypothetical protein
MSTFSESYVCRVLFARPAPSCGLEAMTRRWWRLSSSVFDPYRPELHYMRGPGPKWRESIGAASDCENSDGALIAGQPEQ